MRSKLGLKLITFQLLTLALLVVVAIAINQRVSAQQVVPDGERDAVHGHEDAPTETQGIKSIERLGGIKLGRDFPTLGGKELRVRRLVIEPGGKVAVHQHDKRPGVAYILKGELIEHRQGEAQPLVKKAGDVSFESSGVNPLVGRTVQRPMPRL